MLAPICNRFRIQNACKDQPQIRQFFSLKKVTTFREKGSPKGAHGDPKIKDLGSRLALGPPRPPQRVANGPKVTTFI